VKQGVSNSHVRDILVDAKSIVSLRVRRANVHWIAEATELARQLARWSSYIEAE
jgi:hypothetical protein